MKIDKLINSINLNYAIDNLLSKKNYIENMIWIQIKQLSPIRIKELNRINNILLILQDSNIELYIRKKNYFLSVEILPNYNWLELFNEIENIIKIIKM